MLVEFRIKIKRIKIRCACYYIGYFFSVMFMRYEGNVISKTTIRFIYIHNRLDLGGNHRINRIGRVMACWPILR